MHGRQDLSAWSLGMERESVWLGFDSCTQPDDGVHRNHAMDSWGVHGVWLEQEWRQVDHVWYKDRNRRNIPNILHTPSPYYELLTSIQEPASHVRSDYFDHSLGGHNSARTRLFASKGFANNPPIRHREIE